VSQKQNGERGDRCPVRGTVLVLLDEEQTTPERIMALVFEFLTSALFFMFIVVQVGLVSMIVLARLLKATGGIKEGDEQTGIKGFLQEFC
jgi:hypothetical protein